MTPSAQRKNSSLTASGLFSGIGGFEHGFSSAGIRSELLCEIDDDARCILKAHFPHTKIARDVRVIRSLPPVDVLTAGFPCQDLSQAGRTGGIHGAKSGLIQELFRLLSGRRHKPDYVVLENVPFMLQLNRGHAMTVVTQALEERGYTWAYRVVDARSFALPQRRRRVIIVAGRRFDPRPVLFSDEGGPEVKGTTEARAASVGFYWTEGNTGLGWAPNCLPALKAGSSVSIPSPPAIWTRADRSVALPDIRDAERLQGFHEDWTASRKGEGKHLTSERVRWRLVGNALPVPIARWIGGQLTRTDLSSVASWNAKAMDKWTEAGWGHRGKRYEVAASNWPLKSDWPPLSEFLQFPTRPLSARATNGFVTRVVRSGLRVETQFIRDLKAHHRAQVRRTP